MKSCAYYALIPVAFLLLGCTIPMPSSSGNSAADGLFAGSWRVYSAHIYYDAGGSSAYSAVSTSRQLELSGDGTWKYGSSGGSWAVDSISQQDWQKWGTEPYGPTRKIVLSGWDGSTADGPVEESASRVDFFWLIYKKAGGAGTIQLKFGPGYGSQ